MRALRILCAWLAPTSGHFAAERHRRALVWVALLLAAMLGAPWIGAAPIFVVMVAQIVDAALLRPAKQPSVGRQLVIALVVICTGLLAQVVIRSAWVEAFKIPSGAMIPTLQVGDHIFVHKAARRAGRGDVIVFIYPKEPDKDFIKRVVAVGGDTIEIRDNVLVVNGRLVPRVRVPGECSYEDYLEDSGRWETRRCEAWDETLDGRTYRVIQDPGSVHSWPPVTVPAGEAYVLGDNRDNSHDSRYWGFVPADNIKGTARIIWWSRDWNRVNQRIR